MITALLILHALVGVALLGGITHQAVSLFRRGTVRSGSFVDRYTGVSQKTFTVAVVSLYVINVALGALIYPSYRLDVRIPFEEMSLGWAIGLFELKEHFAGLGLAVAELRRRDRVAITLVLAFIVWWDFLVGHILNNLRGLG
jgi:hypothetical protein